VLVSVSFKQWGNSKKVKGNPAIRIQDADESLIRVTKTLIDSPEIDAVRKHDGETRRLVSDITMPGFFEGIHFISRSAMEGLDAQLSQRQIERVALVNAAADTLEDRAKDTLKRLGDAGDPSEIPTAQAFRDAYSMEWSFLELKVPDSLPSDMKKKEEEKLASRIENATEGIRKGLRAGFVEHVDQFIDRLEGKRENGKIKIFRDSMIENAVKFMTSFNAKNLADDDALAGLVADFRDALDGVTADDLRNVEELRENTLAAMQEIKAKFNALEKESQQ
jgi:hypothetical protein